jgi:hypothetical protein
MKEKGNSGWMAIERIIGTGTDMKGEKERRGHAIIKAEKRRGDSLLEEYPDTVLA